MARPQRAGWWDAEIEWLVNASEGEHGKRGVAYEPTTGAGDDSAADDIRVKAATRARPIRRALEDLRPGCATLLCAAHLHVSPRQAKEVHDAHGEVCKRVGDLMVAVEAFRRAWRKHGGRAS